MQNKLLKIFLGAAIFGLSFGSLAAEEFKAQIMFNGSSSLAPVISKISADFIEENVTWDKVDSSFPNKNIAIYVSSGGSGAGVKSVIEKVSDISTRLIVNKVAFKFKKDEIMHIVNQLEKVIGGK